MGSGNSKPEDEIGSAKSLFKGQKPSVNFVANLVNNTDFGLQFQGSWLKRGLNDYVSSIDSAFGKHPKSVEDLVLAARNEKGFFRKFFGTSGLSLWSIEDTNYCLVLAWDIPHYRKLFKRANTIAVSKTTGFFLSDGITLCGNFRIFLSFVFYVKSILANLEILKLQLISFLGL